MRDIGLRRRVTVLLWKVFRWRFVGEVPENPAGILIGAPHTSNWDLLAMVMITWHTGIHPKFLGKVELFRFPFGPLLRWFGGIPVDRKNPHSLMADLVGRISAGEQFFLVIAPEGTRVKGRFWKSGFYRLATETGLPLTLGFIDRASKTAGFGPTVHVTGKIAADMDVLREFYADKTGIHPERVTEPRLQNERITMTLKHSVVPDAVVPDAVVPDAEIG